MRKGEELLLLSLEQGFAEEQFLFEGKAAMFRLSCCRARATPGLRLFLSQGKKKKKRNPSSLPHPPPLGRDLSIWIGFVADER